MPRQIVLASRPSGWPTDGNFALTEADRPDLADGQVRVLIHAETIVGRLERAPGAFIDLLREANTGKMLVRL
jgi:NADPH-dependent curcumin reductase CurA